MARPLRIEFPGAVYHVTSRGNERKAIFRNDQDRKMFLNTVEQVTDQYNWVCHAYCLMENHYHLLVETPDGNLSIGMRQLNGVYTQKFNKRHRRVGHLFQGRFKAVLVQKESHLLEACRYVVLNPIRAGIANRPEEWEWSSYNATAGRVEPHPCLVTDWVLSQFGSDRARAKTAYRRFAGDGIKADPVWKDLRAQSILGESEFVEGLVEYVKGREKVPEIPKSQRFMNRPDLRTLFGVDVLREKSKRNVRIAEAVQKHGYTQREVANHLGMHFASVSRILRQRKKC